MALAPALLEAGLTVSTSRPTSGSRTPRRTSAGTACPTPPPSCLSRAVYGLPEMARAEHRAARSSSRAPAATRRRRCSRPSPRSRRAPPRATASSSTRSPASRARAAAPSAGHALRRGERGGQRVQGRLAPPHARRSPSSSRVAAGAPVGLTFTPHLVPMTRGSARDRLPRDGRAGHHRRPRRALRRALRGRAVRHGAPRRPDALHGRGARDATARTSASRPTRRRARSSSRARSTTS